MLDHRHKKGGGGGGGAMSSHFWDRIIIASYIAGIVCQV